MDWTPSWTAVEAVGTVLALLLGVIAFAHEWRSRRNERRRAQAEKIAAWIESGPRAGVEWPVILGNASVIPIYHVIAWVVAFGGAGTSKGEGIAPRFFSGGQQPVARMVLPPGTSRVSVPWSGGVLELPAVEVAFTDAAGAHWIRRGDGKLESISKDAIVHYKLPEEWVWEHPQDDD